MSPMPLHNPKSIESCEPTLDFGSRSTGWIPVVQTIKSLREWNFLFGR